MKFIIGIFACFFLFRFNDLDEKIPQLMFLGAFVASKADIKIIFIFCTYHVGKILQKFTLNFF